MPVSEQMADLIFSMKKKKNHSKDFSAAIKSLNSADFDGHTDFISFLHEKKLLWLSNAVQFWFFANKNSLKKATNARSRNND